MEAIQNVNIATNANDAEQGIAGGASVNVMLKSGSNETHGGAVPYNINSDFEANNFFANSSGISKPPTWSTTTMRRLCGRPHHPEQAVLLRQLRSAISITRRIRRSFPSPVPRNSGAISAAPANPIYDPLTGNQANCRHGGRLPLRRRPNTIPGQHQPRRIRLRVTKIIPNIPATNIGARRRSTTTT